MKQGKNKKIKNETWHVAFDARRKHKQWLITNKGNRFVTPSETNMRLIASAPKMYVLLKQAMNAPERNNLDEPLRLEIDACLDYIDSSDDEVLDEPQKEYNGEQ